VHHHLVDLGLRVAERRPELEVRGRALGLVVVAGGADDVDLSSLGGLFKKRRVAAAVVRGGVHDGADAAGLGPFPHVERYPHVLVAVEAAKVEVPIVTRIAEDEVRVHQGLAQVVRGYLARHRVYLCGHGGSFPAASLALQLPPGRF
jgi:hypothetical protein